MQSRWFWNTWSKDFLWIWYALISIFLFSFGLLWFNYFQDAGSVIHWDKMQEQKILESTVHSFHVGPFELTVPADNYVILEYFQGSQIQINQFVLLAFTGILIFLSILLLTVITVLERFWYYVGIVLFTLFIVSLRLEVLSVWGLRNQIPTIVVVSVFALLSFYFQVLNKDIRFNQRFIAFLVLGLVMGVVVYLFSNVPYPMLHLSVTGYSAGLILSVVFILMVAHEIPAAFVYVVSQASTKSLQHFSIICLIYILNIIITCLHELGVIHWNFIYINLYLLLSISAILGLWGFRLRESLYSNILSFSPYGAYFFVGLGTICFITIAQLLGSANDPALRIIRDVIIFSHTGYGIIFLTYVLSNFIMPMAKNMPVYKILYKANRMPYFTFRFAGFIMTLAFIFYSNWHQYVYNGIAGFYNNIADLYELLDRSAIAEAYYEQGRNYGFENNHANYALGVLKVHRFNPEDAHVNYELANGRRPTAFSLVNESHLYLWENKIFESIKSYRRSLVKIPNSGEIENNLGFAYGKIHNLDSSVFYLSAARRYKNTKPSAEANFFGIAALEYLPISCDSVLKIFDDPYAATLGNAVALATSQNQEFKTTVNPVLNGKLNLYSATLLNNYIIRNAKTLDSAFIEQAYAVASDSLNDDYEEALRASLAIVYYHQGNVSKALAILGELVYRSQSYQGKYNYVMGLWVLEQNNPSLAASYFKYAVDSDYKDGKLYYAIALTESGDERAAVEAWDSVATRKGAEAQMSSSMKKILTADGAAAQTMSDTDKYQFCRYKLSVTDTLLFNRLITSFQDPNYRAQALLDMTQRQVEWGNLIQAIHYLAQIGGLKLTDKNLYESIQHMELLMLSERRELRSLSKQINKGVTFGPERTLEKRYYTALLNEAANDTINATKNYHILGTYNPYFESAIIAAANYFRTHGSDKMKAYNILVEAIHINKNSVRLLRAYATEASRMGFPEYAESAVQMIEDLQRKVDD